MGKVETPRTENAARSVPRIPSAFAPGTENDKIAKERIERKRHKLALFYAFWILKYRCAANDG
jgi:hypothetical protein